MRRRIQRVCPEGEFLRRRIAVAILVKDDLPTLQSVPAQPLVGGFGPESGLKRKLDREQEGGEQPANNPLACRNNSVAGMR